MFPIVFVPALRFALDLNVARHRMPVEKNKGLFRRHIFAAGDDPPFAAEPNGV
jgi:hypothetical protein